MAWCLESSLDASLYNIQTMLRSYLASPTPDSKQFKQSINEVHDTLWRCGRNQNQQQFSCLFKLLSRSHHPGLHVSSICYVCLSTVTVNT